MLFEREGGWRFKKIKARSMQSPHAKTMMLFRAETGSVESSVVLSNGGICSKLASLSVLDKELMSRTLMTLS